VIGLCDGLSYLDDLQLAQDFRLRTHLEDDIVEATGKIKASAYYAARVRTMEEEFVEITKGVNPKGGQLPFHVRRIKIELLAGALVNCAYLIDFIRTNKPKEVQAISDQVKQQLCCTFADLLMSLAEGGGLA
jgi:hypothetical protein